MAGLADIDLAKLEVKTTTTDTPGNIAEMKLLYDCVTYEWSQRARFSVFSMIIKF